MADALFNIGCYSSLKIGLEEDVEKSGEAALLALQQCLAIAPENAADFQTDPDFKALWESPEFGSRAHKLLNAGTNPS